MAISTCVKCGGHSFELALFTPLGESRKLAMVQCSQCGAPVGALDPSMTSQMVQCSQCGAPVGALDPSMTSQIEALKRQVAAIDERLNRIAKTLTE